MLTPIRVLSPLKPPCSLTSPVTSGPSVRCFFPDSRALAPEATVSLISSVTFVTSVRCFFPDSRALAPEAAVSPLSSVTFIPPSTTNRKRSKNLFNRR